MSGRGGWQPWDHPGGQSEVLPRGDIENNGTSSRSAMVYDLGQSEVLPRVAIENNGTSFRSAMVYDLEQSEILPRGGIENNGTSSRSAMVYDPTVVDENVLQCGVCFLPLKPPIFQCVVGHVLCSSCSKKLKDARKCHLCRVAMPSGYQRCHAMEDVMNVIRVQCPHAPYGCDTRVSYHGREEHLLECPHSPCHCPAGNACGFVGSMAALVTHLTMAHGWPCTTEASAGSSFGVNLRDGFNFVTAVRGSAQYLFLLNMATTPFGHAISAVRIQSLAAMATNSSTSRNTTTCELELYFVQFTQIQYQRGHYQKSRFQVECMCPSNGLPDPNASFQFFVPKYGGGGGDGNADEAPVIVTVHVTLRLGFV